MEEKTIWALEEQFWLKGESFYADWLDPACLMVFPGLGVMRVRDVLDSLKAAPRWQSVDMTNRFSGRPVDGLIVIAYTAMGRRDDSAPYRCYCTSSYRYDGRRWALIQHQQTIA